ncbi:MAG: hypothetical protein HDR88_15480 [Bacteroides sp.]|nr:hypothetical protein [Bacteroides sp.]
MRHLQLHFFNLDQSLIPIHIGGLDLDLQPGVLMIKFRILPLAEKIGVVAF